MQILRRELGALRDEEIGEVESGEGGGRKCAFWPDLRLLLVVGTLGSYSFTRSYLVNSLGNSLLAWS